MKNQLKKLGFKIVEEVTNENEFYVFKLENDFILEIHNYLKAGDEYTYMLYKNEEVIANSSQLNKILMKL